MRVVLRYTGTSGVPLSCAGKEAAILAIYRTRLDIQIDGEAKPRNISMGGIHRVLPQKPKEQTDGDN